MGRTEQSPSPCNGSPDAMCEAAWRRALRLAAWTGSYLGLAVLGHGAVASHGGASPAWPAAGLAIALLVLQGLKYWPVIAASSLLANFFIAGNPWGGAAGVALGNTVEAVIGAAVLRRLGIVGELSRLVDAIGISAVAILAPIPDALIAEGVLYWVGASPLFRLSDMIFVWWLGNLTGILTTTPLLLAWFGRRSVPPMPARYVEFGFIVLTTLALVSICYGYSDLFHSLGVAFLPLATFLLLPLVWAVLRLNARESLFVLALASALAVTYTRVLASGPFYGNLLALQMMLIGVVSGTLLLIGAIGERWKVHLELLREELRFRSVFDHAAAGMAMLDARGRLIAVNQRLCEIIGYTRGELLGKTFSEISDPTYLDSEPALFIDLLAERKSDYVVEKRYRRKDGSVVWVRISSSLLQGGSLAHCLSIVEDISARQTAEAALLESEERLRYVTDAADVGYWDWDLALDRLEWSCRCKAIFGIDPREEMSYGRFMSTVIPEDQPRVEAAVRNAVQGRKDFEVEFRIQWPDGSQHWIHSKGRVAFGPAGAPVRMAGVAIDVTARKAMEEAVRRLSLHDALTGLPNRALIHEYAGRLLLRARRGSGRVAMIFVDLDCFKPINDTFGHDAGDMVLKEVARRLADCVRGEDFVGRLGGDEFLAVLSHIQSADNAARVAEHALTRLAQPIRFRESSLRVSSSIGLAVFPEDGDTVDDLIKNADTAMYHAKRMGRNNYQFFHPEMNQRAEQARIMERKLRVALEREEFQVHFQPVVQLADGRPRSVEALLRWPAADVGPDRFIPAAETAGLMPAIGVWMLNEVCRQQRRWLDDGLPFLPVAVNISINQLSDEHLPEHIRGATQAAGLQAEGLRVELPEHAVIDHGPTAHQVLSRLRRMGIKVAVDDFGAGMSSINGLGHMGLDSLKLDRSFVRAIGRDPAIMPIIDAILALGRSLRLDVVAEGIESAEALDLLKDRQCPLGQGFLFSPPLPPDEFEAWYREALAA